MFTRITGPQSNHWQVRCTIYHSLSSYDPMLLLSEELAPESWMCNVSLINKRGIVLVQNRWITEVYFMASFHTLTTEGTFYLCRVLLDALVKAPSCHAHIKSLTVLAIYPVYNITLIFDSKWTLQLTKFPKLIHWFEYNP